MSRLLPNPTSFPSKDPTLRVPEHVVSEMLDGEAVIVNLETGHYFSLNEVGACFWHRFKETGSVSEARGAILDAFDVTPEQAANDIAKLIAELKRSKLLEEVPGPEAG